MKNQISTLGLALSETKSPSRRNRVCETVTIRIFGPLLAAAGLAALLRQALAARSRENGGEVLVIEQGHGGDILPGETRADSLTLVFTVEKTTRMTEDKCRVMRRISLEEEPEVLINTVQEILVSLRKSLGRSHREAEPREYSALGLSARETEVAGWAAAGFSNGEIAQKLFIDVTTVKSHLSEVFRKLGIRRRSQIVSRLN